MDGSMVTVVFQKQMDVIWSHNIVQHDQTKAPLGFKEPLNPTAAVMFKFQQELAFVASLGDLPR